jgi:hypothetical protein
MYVVGRGTGVWKRSMGGKYLRDTETLCSVVVMRCVRAQDFAPSPTRSRSLESTTKITLLAKWDP